MKLNKNNMYELLLVVTGNFILALGVALFVIPNTILTGGSAGLAVALQEIIDVDPQVIINVTYVVLYFVGALLMGKKFAFHTLISSFIYPFFVFLITEALDGRMLTQNPLLASIYAGALMGVGIGFVFRAGASTGGLDVLPIVFHKYTGLSLSMLTFICDGLVVAIGFVVYGIEAVLIGLVSVWIMTFIIDKTLVLGTQKSKNVMIISDRYEEIMKLINDDLQRGATIIEARGSYKKERRNVLMVIIQHNQYSQLNHLVNAIDSKAFMVVMDAHEVRGLGFSFQED